jgi:hypothetical protein
MPTLSAQFGGRWNRGRPYLCDSDGLDRRIIYDILHNDIWSALKYLDHYEQDPAAVSGGAQGCWPRLKRLRRGTSSMAEISGHASARNASRSISDYVKCAMPH